MLARYRYRVEPGEAQQAMPARTFGCARVVFNDAIRCRDDAYRTGEKISPAEVRRRVVTHAKTPLPMVDREAGIALGISRLATVADSEGRRADVANPKHLVGKQRKLARLEREKARRVPGGRNRAKTRRKVAVQYSKVSRSRRDYHHKQALNLVRENQAVHVEDLNIAGMVRNRRLARAIHDAGWAQFVRLIDEKAARYGRTLLKVSRWLPSSKTCSACGHVMDAMPLKVRDWVCPVCGVGHDRDHNAAINILAAGRAERKKRLRSSGKTYLRAGTGR